VTSSAALVALSAVAGLIVGSFLTVLVVRVPHGIPLLRPGSSCWSCGHRLRWADLVPVASWLRLRGRCRVCSASIGLRPPVIELATSLLFALTAWRLGPTAELPAILAFVAGGVALAAIDLEHFRLPTPLVRATLGLVALALAAAAALDGAIHPLLTAAAGAVLFTGVLFVAHLVSPRSMGFGDVRLAAVLGAVLGWYGLGAVLSGLLLGHVLGAVLGLAIGLGRRRVRGVRLPFGPPLLAGALAVVLLAGPTQIPQI
jgi:leader peptidase (prepilin peptidase)/N-methyltransferase